MSDKRTASVAVAAATYAIDRPYDYLIPDSLSDAAVVGMRVAVPFGRGNKLSEGVILSVSVVDDDRKLKAIASCLDPEPVLTQEQLRLALWMRDRFSARCMTPYAPCSLRECGLRTAKSA